MKRAFTLIAFIAIFSLAALGASNTFTTTYTTAAVTATAQVVPVYSATGIVAASGTVKPTVLYIDGELMTVIEVNSTSISVLRGQGNTVPRGHRASSVVYIGKAEWYASTDPGGTCTAASVWTDPYINTTNGSFWRCNATGVWGINAFDGIHPVSRVVVDDAAYTAKAYDFYIAYSAISSARAITLPNAALMQGKVITIEDESGSAGSYNLTLAADAINGSTTANCATAAYGGCRLYSNGTSWFTLP